MTIIKKLKNICIWAILPSSSALWRAQIQLDIPGCDWRWTETVMLGGGVNVWRSYGWQTALSAGEKCAEMCFSADISRQSQAAAAASAAPSVKLLQVSLWHTPSAWWKERWGVWTKRKKVKREWENEEHGEMKMWKQREGIKRWREVKMDGGWVIWSETKA